jgi:hypothetical protein
LKNGDRVSDERRKLALEALAGSMETFRSALIVTAGQLRKWLASSRSAEGELARARAELGPFAVGKIDVELFSELFKAADALDADSVEVVERALAALTALSQSMSRSESKSELFVVAVEKGGSLRDAVARALASLGRAFGAARVAELSRMGSYSESEHAVWLEAFPFERWSRAERETAPPLVVELDGPDLQAGGLSEFLDGSQKIVLLVRGDAPPAALVRVVTPRTLVLQACDGAELNRIASFAGPGVAALMPESAARFVHDPMGGERLSDRISVVDLPRNKRCRRLGSLSSFQQLEEFEQLEALARDDPRADYEQKLAEMKARYPQLIARRVAEELLRTAAAGGDLTRLLEKIDVGAVPAARPDVSRAASAAPTAPTALAAGEAAPVEAAEEIFTAPAREPSIDTPRCTSCDECTRLNKKLFAYDGNKQAYIVDPKAGTFKQLVLAAERCTAQIIHPGTPCNPDEPDLEKWIKRASRFK